MSVQETVTLLDRLPPRHRLSFQIERDEAGTRCYTATLFHDPPKEGWPNSGWYFRSEPGAVQWRWLKYLDLPVVVVAVSAKDAKTCVELATSMMLESVGRYETWLERNGLNDDE